MVFINLLLTVLTFNFHDLLIQVQRSTRCATVARGPTGNQVTWVHLKQLLLKLRLQDVAISKQNQHFSQQKQRLMYLKVCACGRPDYRGQTGKCQPHGDLPLHQ